MLDVNKTKKKYLDETYEQRMIISQNGHITVRDFKNIQNQIIS